MNKGMKNYLSLFLGLLVLSTNLIYASTALEVERLLGTSIEVLSIDTTHSIAISKKDGMVYGLVNGKPASHAISHLTDGWWLVPGVTVSNGSTGVKKIASYTSLKESPSKGKLTVLLNYDDGTEKRITAIADTVAGILFSID